MVSDAAFAHQAPGLLENTHIGLRGFSAAQRRDKEAGSILLYCFFKAKPKPKIRFVQLLKINREVYLTAIDIGLD